MIDVIIPCHNEANTIGGIVWAFKCTPNVGHVIVVDNASTDLTASIAARHGACVMSEPELGKGQAIARALPHVSTDMVILCDGDLHDFDRQHAGLMVYFGHYPYQETIFIPDFTQNVPWAKDGDLWGMLSGERVLPTIILRELAKANMLFGYTVEVCINQAVKAANLHNHDILLVGVKGTPRYGKERMDAMTRDVAWMRENMVDP